MRLPHFRNVAATTVHSSVLSSLAVVAVTFTAAGFAWAQPHTIPAPNSALKNEARPGLVKIEVGGKTIATGAVLRGDGRILTALRLDGPDKLSSPDVVVQYDEQTRIRARVMHHDTRTGLALVVPLEGKRTEGYIASEANPLTAPLRWFVLANPRSANVSSLRGPTPQETAAAGAEGWPFGVFIGTGSESAPVGTPLVDNEGNVAAIRTTRCAAVADSASDGGLKTRCTFPAVASVQAVRSFLAHTPLTAVQPPPWLGIVGQASDSGSVRGVRVLAVAPQSPAASGGLHNDPDPTKADVIATIDGTAVGTPDALAETIAKHAPGDKVKLVVFTGLRTREVTLLLHAAP